MTGEVRTISGTAGVPLYWSGVIALEGVETDNDDRLIAPGAVRWNRTVTSVPVIRDDTPEGWIDTIQRVGKLIVATGRISPPSPVSVAVGVNLEFVDVAYANPGPPDGADIDTTLAWDLGAMIIQTAELSRLHFYTDKRPAWRACRVTVTEQP